MLNFLRKAFYIIAAVFLLLFIFQLVEYFRFNSAREAFVQEKGTSTAQSIKREVNNVLNKITVEAERVAKLMGENNLSAAQIENIIKESALSIPELQGVTACFEPFAWKENQQLYCPYYNKGNSSFIQVGDSYDYSDDELPGTEWYTEVRSKGARWVEPYYAMASKDWYVDYGTPFYDKAGNFKGTITMSFVASGFQKLVHNLSVGRTGYGIITSSEGAFLAHPFNDYIGTTNLQDLLEQDENLGPHLRKGFDAMMKGEAGSEVYYNSEQKDTELFFYDQIPASGWGIGVMFYKNDLLEDKNAKNRRLIKLSLYFSGLLLFLIAIYFNKDHLDAQEIWILSGLGAFLILANLFLIGYLQHSASRPQKTDETPPIIDLMNMASFVAQQDERADLLKIPRSINVPTGIYIQRMEFEDSYNINVGGTVWQKYPLEVADSVTIGFTFPQMSPFAEASYIEESYRSTIEAKEDEPGYLLVGYDVRVTLRLNMEYKNYPFDKRHISIEIVPLDKNDHLLFTPDLASYKFTNPSQKSGLDEEIQISGNEVLESYYNYSIKNYTADFGYGQKGLFEEVPVLHFNINIRRILINSFVTYLIPIFVTLIMMFILVFASAKTSERQGIIESMAAFFFVLIFSHIDLRREVVTADLIYMEYYYFITYLMIILSTLNLIIYTKDKAPIFDFNENQLFKASFFPLFLLLLLVVTLSKFY